MSRWGVVVGIYATLAFLSGAAVLWLRGNPFVHPEPWLELSPLTAHAYSALVGLTLGVVVAQATPELVRRQRWARLLHTELRPLVQKLSPGLVVAVALFSALGEELLFRSLLGPLIGLWLQAAAFGLAHQLPGRARWIWVAWASMMGIVLGALFQATGSLLGPIVMHAAINGLNLRYMLHHDATLSPRPVGGVFGQRTG